MNIHRMAVVLVGQYRTWPVCAKYLQLFFNSKATHVDYFFVTWEENSIWENDHWVDSDVKITRESILAYFDQKSQVAKCIVLPSIQEKENFFRVAWLSKIANNAVEEFELEQNFVYDQIVETRPDCIFVSHPFDYQWQMCGNFQYRTFEFLPAGHTSAQLPFDVIAEDTYFRTNSFTYKIFAHRINLKNWQQLSKKFKFGSHGLLAQWLYTNKIVFLPDNHADYFFRVVVRNLNYANFDMKKILRRDMPLPGIIGYPELLN